MFYLNDAESELAALGWENYADSNVTDTAGQSIANGVTAALSIDGAGSTNTSNAPAGSTGLWDTTADKITPIKSGDTYDARLTFIAENYSGSSPYLTLDLDIGGSVGVILSTTIPLLKSGAEQRILIPMSLFSLGTFIANGGTINITYVGTSSVDIHSASLFIKRTGVGV